MFSPEAPGELEARQAKVEAQADRLLNRIIEAIRSKVAETRTVKTGSLPALK